MGRQNHIASEELLNYAEGNTRGEATERVRVHLATGCSVCAAELAAWSRLVAHLEADREITVPDMARQRAFAIMETSPPAPTLLERILAVLTYDSRVLATPSPARAQVAASSSLELLYEAGGIHIGLLCQQAAGVWYVAGQLLSDPAHSANLETNWQVSADGQAAPQRVDADEWNEFRLPELTPGIYTFTLRSPSREIVLPVVELPDNL